MTNDKTNHHLAEVVWVPTTREEPIGDEATARTEDKVLLDISRVVKPVADNEEGERETKVVRKRLKLRSSCDQEVWAAPKEASHANKQMNS